MDFVSRMAESRIRDAVERGELADLPGKGEPLRLDDVSRVPAGLRAGYLLLRNADVLPEEMQLRKEMVSLEGLIRACENDGERSRLERGRREREIRYRILMERRTRTSAHVTYGTKIRRRLGF